jgi:glycosyltransferase involved in cell wall biosynthesis
VTRCRRLLVFTENYLRGGGNRYCVDLVNALAPEYDEIVLASNRGGIFAEDVARLAHNVAIVSAPFLTRSKARHAARNLPRVARAPGLALLSLAEPVLFQMNATLLTRFVRKLAPDAVLSCNGGYPAARAALAMVVAANRARTPAVLSIVSMPTPRNKAMLAYDRLIDRMVWRSVRLVIVNARSIADALNTQHEMTPGLPRTIYNGLPDVSHRARAKSGAEVGFVARLDRAKGVLVLLDAFNTLAPRWPTLELRLIGEGDASAAVAARAKALGIAHRVNADGYSSADIERALESFLVYAFPSFHEGLPYSILEAMRAGCAIVSTAVGGIPEILRDGQDALLVPARDSIALANAIESLLSDDRLRAQLGKAARLRFEEKHRLEIFGAEVVRAFVDHGLLAKDRTPTNE